MERRQHVRYGVSAPVHFMWQEEGLLHQGSGVTRDISSKGMFIYSEFLPLANAELEIEVSFVLGAGSRTEMRAKVLVIRVDPKVSPDKREGFAVLNRSYTLSS